MKHKEIFQIISNPIETSKRRITADKREIKDFPKFVYRRTSFTLRTLYEIVVLKHLEVNL